MAVGEAEKNMVFAARLTQRGHRIRGMDDLMELYEKTFTDDTVEAISSLPHPAVQKFAVITVAVTGASRRFLAQITRHQKEVQFMSASLQYSNYAGQADFAVPYEIMAASLRRSGKCIWRAAGKGWTAMRRYAAPGSDMMRPDMRRLRD